MSQSNPQALPEIGRMNALKEDFLKQHYTTTQALLPVLREQLGGLVERLLSTDRLLADRVLGALVLVGNHKWGDVAELLEETRRLPNLDDEQREAMVRSKARMLEEDALRDAQRLEGKGQEVADALAALAKVRLPVVDERLAGLTEQQEALDASIRGQKARVEALDTQIAAMAEVIQAFEAPNLQKILNRLIPTETELALVQQSLLKGGVDPEALVTAARLFVDKLSDVVEGRKLVDVISTRNRKVIERGELLDELCAWEARRASLARELGQLSSVGTLGALRDEWLGEAMTLVRSWTAMLEGIRAQTDLHGMADALSAMADYLLAVRRRYEAL